MEKFEYLFKNFGTSENNDDVIDFREFDTENIDYTIKLTPKPSTKYWRFGIALSQKKGFDFDPRSRRYKDKSLKYIEIDVGDRASGKWEAENKIAIGSYEIKGFEESPKIKSGYRSTSPVEVTLSKDSGDLVIGYTTTNVTDIEKFPVGDYRYARLFAWADGVPFELDMEMTIDDKNKPKEKPVFVEVATNFSVTDKFNPAIQVTELATEISDLLESLEDDKGNMFGIFGKWGRGKTFLWNEIWKKLSQKKDGN